MRGTRALHDLSRSVASRNLGAGFQVDGPSITLSGNVAIGNGGAGVQIDAASDAPVLAASDFIANGGSDGNFCGVSNLALQPVAATQSYWGAATGPASSSRNRSRRSRTR